MFSYSGETTHFRDLRSVELRSERVRRTFNVVAVEVHNTTPVLYLEGIETPEMARTLAGWEVWVPLDQAAQLGPGEYYVSDLVGMNLVQGTQSLGKILSVVEGYQAPLLEVDLGGRTVLVPFMEQYLGVPDQDARTLELLTPWILDTE